MRQRNSHEKKEIQEGNRHLEVILSLLLARKDPSMTKEELQEKSLVLSKYTTISSSIDQFDKAIQEAINAWAINNLKPLEDLMQAYYSILTEQRKKQRSELLLLTNNERNSLEELTSDERELLELSENFDVDSLNLYKKLTSDEEALLQSLSVNHYFIEDFNPALTTPSHTQSSHLSSSSNSNLTSCFSQDSVLRTPSHRSTCLQEQSRPRKNNMTFSEKECSQRLSSLLAQHAERAKKQSNRKNLNTTTEETVTNEEGFKLKT